MLGDDHLRPPEGWPAGPHDHLTQSPNDPDVGLLKFSAASAEYWDSPGGKLASLFSFVKAKVTGESFDADNEKVELPDA